MSQKETQVLFQLISEFINKLSREEYEKLVNGSAVMECKIMNESPRYNLLKESLLKSKSIEEIESRLKGLQKKEIISFCEFCNIDTKSKDTKKSILQKIAAHFNIEHVEQVNSLLNLKEEFHQCTSTEEAQSLLTNHPLLKTKKDIISFAKLLDVYIHPKQTKEMIRNRIIESVIGSRIRARVIKEA